MNIKLRDVVSWSIGSYAKAKFFAVKEQNKDDIYSALEEIVDSYQDRLVAYFYTDIECIDNPKLNGIYVISLHFNRNGDTFFKIEELYNLSFYLNDLQIKDIENYRAFIQDLFDAIVDTREFKLFTQKATKNIQEYFKDVIEPLYKGEFRISDDELDLDRDEITEEERRNAINGFMKLKGRIVSSSTLSLSRPEFEKYVRLAID